MLLDPAAPPSLLSCLLSSISFSSVTESSLEGRGEGDNPPSSSSSSSSNLEWLFSCSKPFGWLIILRSWSVVTSGPHLLIFSTPAQSGAHTPFSSVSQSATTSLSPFMRSSCCFSAEFALCLFGLKSCKTAIAAFSSTPPSFCVAGCAFEWLFSDAACACSNPISKVKWVLLTVVSPPPTAKATLESFWHLTSWYEGPGRTSGWELWSLLSSSRCELAWQPFSTALQAVKGGGERSSVPTSLPMLMSGGLWMSAGLSSTHDVGSGPRCLLGSAPGDPPEEVSGRVLIGSAVCGLRSEWAIAGFRESRWAGGAKICVHLASERMDVSVSSGKDKEEQNKMLNWYYSAITVINIQIKTWIVLHF